VCNPDPTTLGV
jgi:hypothetical protein